MKKSIERMLAYILVFAMVMGLFPVPMANVSAEGEAATASETDATGVSGWDYYDSNDSLTEEVHKSVAGEGERVEPANGEGENLDALNETTEDATEEETEDAQDVEFSAETQCDGFIIKVEADPGVFPEGSTLKAAKVSDAVAETEGVYDAVEDTRNGDINVAVTSTFDITVFDADGNEIEPDNEKGEVRVTFTNPLIADSNLDANVYHIKEENAEKVAEKLDTDESGEAIEVTTDGFSYYTVEFTYDGLQYVMEGDTALPLSTILDFVGLTGTVEDAYSSNDELFSVMKAVLEERTWVESSDGEWMVIANKAFSSNETLTVTINGVEYVIDVTDAQYDTNYNKTAEALVKSVLGDGLNATNCSRTGTVYTFSGGESDIGFDNGVILSCTGAVAQSGIDSDLAKLVSANGQQYGQSGNGNTSTLEFELIATGTLLNFNYVFASQEFDQAATFNDIFGLFVSVNNGAYENIALIERTNGTHVPVTITNLRAGVSGTEMNNGTGTNPSSGTHSLFNYKTISVNGNGINGISIVFNAQKEVHKGDKVRIKFAICNVGDNSVPSHVLIQASSLKFDTPGAKPNYLTEYLYDLEPNTTYRIEEGGVAYTLTTDAQGKVPLSGKDKNNKTYDFIGKTISITMLDSKGQVASETQDLGIAARPAAPDDPSAPVIDIAVKPADVHDVEIETTDTTITVHGPAENEYKLDNGSWTKPTNGTVVFNNLTPNHEYTVYTRVAATEDHPYGETSEGEHIRTNAVDLQINIINYQGIYDGQLHGASVTTPVAGAEIAWSDEYNTNYSATKPTYKNVGTYTVYYRVVKENCYPAYGALTVKINTAPVTVKADDKSKVRNESDPPLTATVTGVLEGESIDQISYTLSRASGENAGTYKITPSGAATQGNYSVTYKTGNFFIAANANHGSVSMADWTYGKTANNPVVTADYGASTATFTYYVDAECTTKTNTSNGASSVGGKPSQAGTYYVVANIPATTNYNGLTTSPDEFEIKKAEITITAANKSSVYGETLQPFTHTITGDYKSGDNLGITLSSPVTTNPVYGSYDINVSWNNNPNYTVTINKGTYNITKRPITVVPVAKTKTYGQQDPELTLVLKQGSSYAPGDGIGIFSGKLTRAAGENVGSYVISKGTLSVNDNYQMTFENSSNISLTITRKQITIKAKNLEKIYGELDPALTYDVTGLEPGDYLIGSLERGDQEDAGVYTNSIVQGTLTNANNANYDIVFTPGTFTINKRVVSILINNKSKVYGQDDPEFDFMVNTVTPLVRNDTIATAFTGTLAREDSTNQNVGKYKIGIGTLESANYTIIPADGEMTITKKPITLMAYDKVQVYGNDEIPLTFGLTDESSMAYGENILDQNVISGYIARENGIEVGEYEISKGTLESSNYNITFINGTYAITPRPLVVVPDRKTKVYGEDDPTLTFKLSNGTSIATWDSVSDVFGNETTLDGDTFTGPISREEGENVGTYVITKGALTVNRNYTLIYTNPYDSIVLEITRKPINVSADNKSKIYGDDDPALTFTIDENTPLVGDDTLAGALTRTAVEGVGEYPDYILQGTVTNDENPNYDITFIPGKFSITKRPVTLIPYHQEKTYGDEDPIFDLTSFEVSGDTPLVKRDDLSVEIDDDKDEDVFAGLLTREDINNQNVGEYKILIGTLESHNYEITLSDEVLIINKKAVTVIAEDKTKVYGEDDPELTFVLDEESELAYGENLYEIATGELARVGAIPATEIALTDEGDDAETIEGEGQNDNNEQATEPTEGEGQNDSSEQETELTEGEGEGESENVEPAVKTIQDVGDYAIIQHTLSLGNNYDVTLVEGNLSITKKPINITMDDQTKVYGDEDPDFTFALDETTPLAYDEELLEIMEGEGGREEGKDVGEYTISEGTLDSSNYEITWTSGTLVITKRPIIIIAEDKEKDYGLEDPELTYINDETTPLYEDDELIDAIKVLLVREEGEKFGEYVIDENGIESKNYDVTFKKGTFTINKDENGAQADITSDDNSDDGLNLITPYEDILKMLLSEEDLQMIKDGAGVRLYFVTTHLDKLSSDESTMIQNATPEGYVVGDHYDISLFKKYSFKEEPDQLYETPYEVEFELNMKLPDLPEGATREFELVRMHEGVAEVIPVIYNADTNTIRFATDRFSTFTLVYKDTMKQSDAKSIINGIKTGDPISLALVWTLMTISVFGIVNILYRKRKNHFTK